MATNKRMFSNDIVGSDAFLEMPPSTQALYFHLGMRADDDGFVSPKMVMRLVGSSDDELKVLVAKKFVLPFQDGVLVIKHWKINNNKIQGDRYKPTLHQEKLKTLFTKDNGAYTLDQSQDCLQSVNSPLTQKRIEENRREEKRTERTSVVVLREPENLNIESWKDWEDYRKERRLVVLKDISKKKQWEFLCKYSKSEQKEVIDTSIANSWQGLFPLKPKFGAKPVQNVLKSEQTDDIIKKVQSKIIQA